MESEHTYRKYAEIKRFYLNNRNIYYLTWWQSPGKIRLEKLENKGIISSEIIMSFLIFYPLEE